MLLLLTHRRSPAAPRGTAEHSCVEPLRERLGKLAQCSQLALIDVFDELGQQHPALHSSVDSSVELASRGVHGAS